MKLRMAAALVLACLSQTAIAEFAAWRIEPAGLKRVDAAVEVKDGHYWAFPDDVIAMGLDTSKLTAENGLIDLASIGQVTLDEQNSSLKIETKPYLLPRTKVDMANTSIFMSPAKPSGSFLNYDIRADHTNASSLAGLFEANTFVRDGIRLNWMALMKTGQAPQRLSASVSKEDPTSATTWMVGDGYSRAGAGVAPARFVGLQYRKDYSLAPGFITAPTFNVAGTAAAPSTLDVLLGNQVVRSQQIPAGPFDITNIQPLIGASGATIVVTDAFGQQQLINSQVTGNPSLLKEGLDDFTIQVGAIRPTLQHIESPFLSGFYRRGISQTFTLEGNAEASQAGSTLHGVRHAGLNAAWATPYGNFSAGGRIGTGNTLSAGYQNAWRGSQWNKSLSASVTKSSSDFLQLGGGLVSPLVVSIQATVQRDRLSLNALHSKSFGQRLTTIAAIYSPSNPRDITWSASAMHLSGTTSSTTFMVSASVPLDGRVSTPPGRTHSSSVSISSSLQSMDYSNRPIDAFGATYRARAERGSTYTRTEAFANYRAYEADVGVAASALSQPQNDQTGLRAYARGAVVFDESTVLPTRWIDSGYAVVDAGTPGAVVQVNGMPNAKTNADGKAVASGFPPFMKTAIRLSPETLPDNFDDVTREISTHRKAGTKVQFRGHSMAMVRVPGYTSGVLTVDDQDYPLTDRGAFLELPQGEYIGMVSGKKVHFTIPIPTSELAVVDVQFPTL